MSRICFSSLVQNSVQNEYEIIYPLTSNSGIFKGKKPTGLLFADGKRIDIRTWKGVFREIMKHCNNDPEKHVDLITLQGKISGRDRVLLTKTSDNMCNPIQVSENLYVETHYDTETLLRILTTRILDIVKYDYSGISIAIRNT